MYSKYKLYLYKHTLLNLTQLTDLEFNMSKVILKKLMICTVAPALENSFCMRLFLQNFNASVTNWLGN